MSNRDLLQELEQRLSYSEKTIKDQNAMLESLRELNVKLEQSESLKSHFLSNIKNEINNPLASILALSLNLLQKQNIPGDIKRSISLVYQEASSLGFQLDNIMTAAELEAGESNPQFSVVNAAQVVNSVVHSFTTLSLKRGVTIVNDTPTSLHFATDAHYLKIIVANLLSNAIKFSPTQASITLHLSSTSEQLLLTVLDAGHGVEEANRKKIFDRFTQLDIGSSKKYQGHGLGLSVVKDLVQLLDGSITFESELHSTRVSVILPVRLTEDGSVGIFPGADEILFDEQF